MWAPHFLFSAVAEHLATLCRQFVLMSLIKLLLDVLISGVTPRVPGGRYAVSMKLESES